jgi:hypothetical protein
VPWEKPLKQQRELNNKSNSPQFEQLYKWWKASALTTAPHMLLIEFMCRTFITWIFLCHLNSYIFYTCLDNLLVPRSFIPFKTLLSKYQYHDILWGWKIGARYAVLTLIIYHDQWLLSLSSLQHYFFIKYFLTQIDKI